MRKGHDFLLNIAWFFQIVYSELYEKDSRWRMFLCFLLYLFIFWIHFFHFACLFLQFAFYFSIYLLFCRVWSLKIIKLKGNLKLVTFLVF